ncbi:hypothetical protein CYMTET_28233 [Cymbomonas tetramitiformis]|uniref:Uncharacterized protein n=1 Tax=Cymbomonas tetramitiformis TaxID=36881 RepID=A0AAE0KWD6_9CHLO|nr:hypothetical protein CYMTET_28233 [Cymbomonas tetramitiformis]
MTAAVFLDMATTEEKMAAMAEMDMEARAEVISKMSDFGAADVLKNLDLEDQLELAKHVSETVASDSIKALGHDDPEMAQRLLDAMKKSEMDGDILPEEDEEELEFESGLDLEAELARLRDLLAAKELELFYKQDALDQAMRDLDTLRLAADSEGAAQELARLKALLAERDAAQANHGHLGNLTTSLLRNAADATLHQFAIASIRSSPDVAPVLNTLQMRSSCVAIVQDVDNSDVGLLADNAVMESAHEAFKAAQAQFAAALSTPESPPPEKELLELSQQSHEAVNKILGQAEHMYDTLMSLIQRLLQALLTLADENNILGANKKVMQATMFMKPSASKPKDGVSDFLTSLMSAPVIDMVHTQEDATKLQSQALAYIKDKYGLEGMICELGYDPMYDDDGKDDPDTYDDNIFVVVSNTEGGDLKPGDYLPQDPARSEYISANTKQKVNLDKATTLAIILDEDCPLQTYGDVYGTLTVMGDEEKKKEAMKDLEFLQQKLAVLTGQVKRQQHDAHEKLQENFNDYHALVVDSRPPSRTENTEQAEVKNEDKKKDRAAKTFTDSIQNISYLNNHKNQLERLLMGRQFSGMVMELRRYRKVSAPVVAVVSAVQYLVDPSEDLMHHLEHGFPRNPQPQANLWDYVRGRIVPSVRTENRKSMIEQSMLGKMVQFLPKANREHKDYLDDMYILFTPKAIKKASKVAEVMNDWLIAILSLIKELLSKSSLETEERQRDLKLQESAHKEYQGFQEQYGLHGAPSKQAQHGYPLEGVVQKELVRKGSFKATKPCGRPRGMSRLGEPPSEVDLGALGML